MHPNEVALLQACIVNYYNWPEVEALFQASINVNIKSASGRAALHWTAENNNAELTSLLLKHQADKEIRNLAGQTPLHLAASCNSLDVMRHLILTGANIEAEDAHGLTPLHWAAFKGYREAANMLVAAGARVDSKDHAGVTPIQLAFSSGHQNLSFYLTDCYHYLRLRSSASTKHTSQAKQKTPSKHQIQPAVSPIKSYMNISSSPNLSAFQVVRKKNNSLSNLLSLSPALKKEKETSQVTPGRLL